MATGLLEEGEWEAMVGGDRHTTVIYWLQSIMNRLHTRGAIHSRHLATISVATSTGAALSSGQLHHTTAPTARTRFPPTTTSNPAESAPPAPLWAHNPEVSGPQSFLRNFRSLLCLHSISGSLHSSEIRDFRGGVQEHNRFLRLLRIPDISPSPTELYGSGSLFPDPRAL